MYVCMYVCMFVCMLHVCMDVCMYAACMYVCTYVSSYMCMYVHTYVHMCVCMYTCYHQVSTMIHINKRILYAYKLPPAFGMAVTLWQVQIKLNHESIVWHFFFAVKINIP